MPPKQPTTDHLLQRILAILEALAQGLATESARRDSQHHGIAAILNQLSVDIATMPQDVAQTLSGETLDRLRHIKFWLGKLEQHDPTGPHALPPALPPTPTPPPLKDPTQPIPLMVELHGRWGWSDLKPKLWKAAIWIAVGGGGAVLSHIHEIVRWLVAHAQ